MVDNNRRFGGTWGFFTGKYWFPVEGRNMFFQISGN